MIVVSSAPTVEEILFPINNGHGLLSECLRTTFRLTHISVDLRPFKLSSLKNVWPQKQSSLPLPWDDAILIDTPVNVLRRCDPMYAVSWIRLPSLSRRCCEVVFRLTRLFKHIIMRCFEPFKLSTHRSISRRT